ncbi:MAG: SDR family oxidoreductase, partial [SAR324 cluster bacterium]|nr:SDR family oxidoreductase [SAR324 cluster bacterium]
MTEKSRKIMIITGATRGLGRVMIEKFIDLGHTVCGCGRSEGAIAELQKQYPMNHHFNTVDVSNARDVNHWAQGLLAKGIVPDMLINNAAVMNRPSSLWEISAEEFSEIVDVNIKGVAHVVQAFVPAMVQQKSGIIVNFSSGWGRSTSPEVGPYCTTKWAIEGFSQSLSQELPQGMA